MKKNYLLQKAGVALIVLFFTGTSIIITTAEYDENQNTIFEQNIPDTSIISGEWLSDTAIMSPRTEPNIACEDFFDVQLPIHEIIWWGNELTGEWPDLILDDHENMLFDIIFYEDLDGEPGQVVVSYNNVMPEITDTGLEYTRNPPGGEPVSQNLYRFMISDLNPPCSLSDGWISIQGVDGDDGLFFWQESLDGNDQCYVGADMQNLAIYLSDLSLIFKTDTPEMTTFTGPSNGKAGKEIMYTIMANGYNDYDMYYYIDWGDGNVDDWIGPHTPGEEITVSHTWAEEGQYTIQVKAKNSMDMETDYITLEVSMPKTKMFHHPLFRYIENHPHLFPLLQRLLQF